VVFSVIETSVYLVWYLVLWKILLKYFTFIYRCTYIHIHMWIWIWMEKNNKSTKLLASQVRESSFCH